VRLWLASCTRGGVGGADRDWINILNALGGQAIKVRWLGIRDTEAIRQHLRPDVVDCLQDVGFPMFDYVLQGRATERRSSFLWSKVLLDHLVRVVSALARARQVALTRRGLDVVVSNSAAVTVGAVAARFLRLPHVWCVKEWLDPAVPACRHLARFIIRFADRVLVPSRAMAEIFGSRAEIVPDGSDVHGIVTSAARASPAEVIAKAGLPRGLPIVAQVGGLVPWKGQHIMARALLELARKRPESPVAMVYCGTGEGAYVASLKRTLDGLPVQWRDKVCFVSYGAGDFSLLNVADIVVHPSVLPDPYPNAVREAMILGKPVIASRTGGIPELIEDGKTGLLVPPGDVEALETRLSALLEDATARSRLGDNARDSALRQFDARRCALAFYRVLLEVVEDSRRGGR
jgi:glycosyltransferase involved in cell wall biosynthesis